MEERPLLINSMARGDVKGYYVEAVNRPGVLWRILDVFRKYDVNVVSINFSPAQERQLGLMFIVVDAKDAEKVDRQVVSELRGIDGVVSVEPEQQRRRGLLVDHYHFPIVDGMGLRCLLVNEHEYGDSLRMIRESFGSPGLALLYHEGRAIGMGYAKLLSELGVEDLRDLITMCLDYAKTHGAFKGEILEYSFDRDKGGKITIRLYDLWECEVAKRAGVREPASHKTRGILAGLVEGFTGRKANVREELCIAKGDPYCQFTIEV